MTMLSGMLIRNIKNDTIVVAVWWCWHDRDGFPIDPILNVHNCTQSDGVEWAVFIFRINIPDVGKIHNFTKILHSHTFAR